MSKEVIRILLIEDDEDDYILTKEQLSDIEGQHYQLDWVRTYQAGLKAAIRNEHDVYLVDYLLGRETGLDLLKSAVEQGCTGPLILLTGAGDRTLDMEAMKLGAADYLVKGEVDSVLLERSIRYAIDNARLLEDLKRERNRLISVEEEIRRRLARDLHDGPAQLLAANVTSIEIITRLLQTNPEMVPAELQNFKQTAEKALYQLRTLLFDLRPVILETQGLIPALEMYLDKQNGPTQFVFNYNPADFPARFSPLAERTIFSIIHEAVGNIKKHAQAKKASVSLTKQARHLMVVVQDDGKGFNVKEMNIAYDRQGSLGMINIRERTQTLGGQLTLDSAPGKGTIIQLAIPWRAISAPEVE